MSVMVDSDGDVRVKSDLTNKSYQVEMNDSVLLVDKHGEWYSCEIGGIFPFDGEVELVFIGFHGEFIDRGLFVPFETMQYSMRMSTWIVRS